MQIKIITIIIDNDYSDDDDDDKGDPIDNDMKIQRQQCWQGNPREGWIHPRPKSFHPDDNDDEDDDNGEDLYMMVKIIMMIMMTKTNYE